MAAAFVAVSAFAQGTYKYESAEPTPAGTTVDAVPNCTLTFGVDGEANYKAMKAGNYIDGFDGFCEGNGVNGKFAEGVFSGTFYELKPAVSGNITVYVCLNADKKFYVYENGEVLPDFNGITESEKYYGSYKFNVTGGKTYDVLCTGSKLGFFGFTYEADESGVSTAIVADENAPIFNAQGVRVNADAKGLLIQNGKKFIRK